MFMFAQTGETAGGGIARERSGNGSGSEIARGGGETEMERERERERERATTKRQKERKGERRREKNVNQNPLWEANWTKVQRPCGRDEGRRPVGAHALELRNHWPPV